jgi:ParB family chromosome partitioning protein
MTREGKISAGHARALLAFDNEAMIYEVADNIVKNNLTVRDVERLAKMAEKSGTVTRSAKRRDTFYDEVELSLTEILGRRVKVYNGRRKGTLEIEFYSAEDLKELANRLGEE